MAKSRKPKPGAAQRRLYTQNRAIRAKVPKRLRQLADDFGGVTKFARAHSLDPKYVYKWLSQGKVPSSDSLIRFAVTSNISPDWLLFGRGTPYLNGRKPTTAAKKAA